MAPEWSDCRHLLLRSHGVAIRVLILGDDAAFCQNSLISRILKYYAVVVIGVSSCKRSCVCDFAVSRYHHIVGLRSTFYQQRPAQHCFNRATL